MYLRNSTFFLSNSSHICTFSVFLPVLYMNALRAGKTKSEQNSTVTPSSQSTKKRVTTPYLFGKLLTMILQAIFVIIDLIAVVN